MALRNYMYSKHNKDNNINSMIFHSTQQSSVDNLNEPARETFASIKETNTTEILNDEERQRTLVSVIVEDKLTHDNHGDFNSRNDSINTLNSVSDIVMDDIDLTSIQNSTDNVPASS